ncbi:MAG: FxLYD domain-containing protein [Bryobacteraceae bacterium]
MQPNAPPADSKNGKFGRLRGWLHGFINGRTPTDPLYLTNRTWKQKLKSGLLIAIPVVLLAGVAALGLGRLYAPKAAPLKEPTSAEIVAHLLPDLEKTVDATPLAAEIPELHTDIAGSPKLIGALKNNTDRTITVEFTVDLTDIMGSKVDSVSERVENAPAKKTVPFQFPIRDKNAARAQVQPGTLKVVN